MRRKKGTGIKCIAVIHDEILLEADADEAGMAASLLKNAMEYAGSKILAAVPCLADAKAASSWAEK